MSDDLVDRTADEFGSVAKGWERWADLMAEREDAERYIRAADVRPGDRVLEIGAGSGDQTLALAERVGPDGHVLATDISEEMLTVARKRVDAAGFDNVQFRLVDADRLDIEEDTFDAAISGLTWMLLPDPVGSASTVRGLLEPGGRFAASVWGPPAEVPMLSVAVESTYRQIGLDAPGADDEAPELSDPQVFHEILEEAEFDDVSVEPFILTWSWESPELYARWAQDVVTGVSDLIEEHAPDQAWEVHAAIADAVRPHARGDDTVTLDNLALLGAGRRPPGD